MTQERRPREGWEHPFEDTDRNAQMTDMRDAGWRTKDLADYFDITQQRVYYITNRERDRRKPAQQGG